MYAIKRRIFRTFVNNGKRQYFYGFANIFFVLFVILIINTIYLLKFTEVSEICTLSGGSINIEGMTGHMNFMIIGSLSGMLIAGILCFGFAILLTHRFFGPMIPINRHFDDMMKGNFDGQIQLRKDDELHDLCKRLNELTTELKENYVRK